jgi:hypothetical protein
MSHTIPVPAGSLNLTAGPPIPKNLPPVQTPASGAHLLVLKVGDVAVRIEHEKGERLQPKHLERIQKYLELAGQDLEDQADDESPEAPTE